jgi:hypothetical protein
MTSPVPGTPGKPILPDYAPVDPNPYFQKYRENLWAAVKGYLDAVADAAAAPVIEKYTGALGAVDVSARPRHASRAVWRQRGQQGGRA